MNECKDKPNNKISLTRGDTLPLEVEIQIDEVVYTPQEGDTVRFAVKHASIVAADVYNTGNGNALLGRLHISRKNRWFMAGSGHDNTSGRSEAGAAVGQYSLIDANTIFAVGNGTSHTDRKNAFEVRADGFVLPSPNGTRYLVSVSDTGELTATPIT